MKLCELSIFTSVVFHMYHRGGQDNLPKNEKSFSEYVLTRLTVGRVIVILVSAQGPNPYFFNFWGTFIQLGGLLGQGLELGPGLVNCTF